MAAMCAPRRPLRSSLANSGPSHGVWDAGRPQFHHASLRTRTSRRRGSSEGVAHTGPGPHRQAKRSVSIKYFALLGWRKGALPRIIAIQDGVIGREQILEWLRVLEGGHGVQLAFSVHPENFDKPRAAGQPLAKDVVVSVRVPRQRASLVGSPDASRHAVAKASVTCFTKELRFGKPFCPEGTRVEDPAGCIHNIFKRIGAP